MKTRGTLRLATRGSALARRQAALVRDDLEERRYEVELVTVETTGDQIRDELIHRLGKTGAFVRELDERVLDGDLDAAVHSLKDVPTETVPELVTAAVPERGEPGDALVTPDGSTLEELPDGAVVGTSSLRRRAQLLAARPDLSVEALRGNVDTRIEKLLAPALQAEHQERIEDDGGANAGTSDGSFKPTYDDREDEDASDDGKDDDPTDDGSRSVDDWFDELSEIEKGALGREVETEYDAIVLAEVGLVRSGLAHQVDYQRLPTKDFVPAPGQGALAVSARDGETAEAIRSAIDHPRSRVEVTVERTLLAELGGGCIAPIGVYAVVQGEYVHATVQVFDRDGERSVVASRDLPIETYPEAARKFAAELADRGAAELIDEAQEVSEPEGEPEPEGEDDETAVDESAPAEGEPAVDAAENDTEAADFEPGDAGMEGK